jgi:hypothetical protein
VVQGTGKKVLRQQDAKHSWFVLLSFFGLVFGKIEYLHMAHSYATLLAPLSEPQ